MAGAGAGAGAPDLRRQVGSPRPKSGRDRDTLCRNITIYGKCRYENAGCNFNHEQPTTNHNNHSFGIADASKRVPALNGDSPSFTPSSLMTQPPTMKKSSLPSASAPVFTPKGTGAATPAASEPDRPFNLAAIKEFTPAQSSFDLSSIAAAQTVPATPEPNMSSYDPFSTPMPPAAYNPYATGNDHTSIAGASAYYQNQGAYSSPLQPPAYHLYANIGPYREDLLPYQRQTRDFFMSDDLREELQKKSHAARQVIPSSIELEAYHSLVPLDKADKLDTHQRKNASIFGWVTWLFKATSAKNGKYYCLRRIQDYRVTELQADEAIQTVKKWKQINNSSIAFVHEVFTAKNFFDRSLMFTQDYFPLAQTLVEVHLTPPPKDHRYRGGLVQLPKVPESVIWSYVVQIANALKAIHAKDLAARCLDPSKIIVTDKNRIRLTACAILEVIQSQPHRTLAELQEDDFRQLGRLILCLGTGKSPNQIDVDADINTFSRRYQPGPRGENPLRDLLLWLLTAPAHGMTAANLIKFIAPQIVDVFDKNLQYADTLTSELHRELENGRLARLLMKLGMINERPEHDHDPNWSEHGDRFPLKLFRDFVFHRVDELGRPVFDMGHMLNSLNKLDAGSNERIRLTTRDNQNDFIISYAELKKQLNGSFAELMKHNRRS
ncbi:unnamed protein product [Discula destructiva]